MQTLAVAVSLGANLIGCKPSEVQTASDANLRHCKPAGLHPLRSAISAALRRIVVFSWTLKIDPARSANLLTDANLNSCADGSGVLRRCPPLLQRDRKDP